uniref:Uncharacterized protein n=1 Tax=Anguilla anguilla TaxID=7936 RepID=A0A0E9PNI9_ANGAN
MKAFPAMVHWIKDNVRRTYKKTGQMDMLGTVTQTFLKFWECLGIKMSAR